MRSGLHTKLRLWLPAFIACAAIFLILPLATRAASFTPGCTGTTGDVAALQSAITTASSNSEVDTITLSADCTYTLATQLSIGADGGRLLTIDGNGATISGNDTVRVFNLATGAQVVVNDLTITAGRVNPASEFGGAILTTSATLTLNDSAVTDSEAWIAGGIMISGGTVTLNNSSVSGNVAAADGGGIRGSGTLIVNNSTISNNQSTVDGAGVNFVGTFTLTNSIVSGNVTQEDGGGLKTNTGGTMTLINTTVTGNRSVRVGGGIFAEGGTITLTNSTVTGNEADLQGGGIYQQSGSLTLNNSTVADNDTDTAGGGIYRIGGTLALNNSLLSNNTGGTDCDGTSSGVIAQFSLVESGGCGVIGGANGNITGVDPALTALQGSPAYYPLTSGSLAVDAGSNALIPVGVTTDQAGNPRIQNGCVDMGSFESAFSTSNAKISISAPTTVAEGSSGVITLTRSCANTAVSLVVTIDISLSSAMMPDSDFTLTGATGSSGSVEVTFPLGMSSTPLDFTALTDSVGAEADDSLFISIVDSSSYDLSSPSTATVTIPANDLLVVNTNAIGEGSLRQAITNANTFPTNDIIGFDTGGTIGGSMPTITANGSLGIDGSGMITLDGNWNGRVFDIAPGANVSLNNLVITRGSGSFFSGGGGGIRNQGGTVLLYNVTVMSGILFGTVSEGGAGILNVGGTMTLNQSTVRDNNAGSNLGGGIANYGTLILNNSTVSGNSAGSQTSGGVYNNGVSTTLNHVTVASNTGGGLRAIGSTTIRNSIIADNTTADCTGTVTAQYSLVEIDSCGVPHGISGNLTGIDPKLQPLTGNPAYYPITGGIDGSDAIDAGNGSITPTLTTDQRGVARPQGLAVDMGSYEAIPGTVVTFDVASVSVEEGSSTIITVSRTGDTSGALVVDVTLDPAAYIADFTITGSIDIPSSTATVTFNPGDSTVELTFEAIDDISAEPENALTLTIIDSDDYDPGTMFETILSIPANDLVVTALMGENEGTLEQAVANANAFVTDDVITFAVSGEVIYFSELVLQGNGTLTIDGDNQVALIASDGLRVFNVASGADVTLSQLLIRGNQTGTLDGGVIYISGGSLTIEDSAVVDSVTEGNGGAIYNAGGTLTVNRSGISSNESVSGSGGAIYNDGGAVTLNNTTLAFNASYAASGGGIYNAPGGTVTLNNTTVTANYAASGGGVANDGTLLLRNSILANSVNGDCIGTATAQFTLVEDEGCGVLFGVDGNLTLIDPELGAASMFYPIHFMPNIDSPVIDAGSDALVPLGISADQIGEARIQGSSVDIGSVEFDPDLPIVTVTVESTNVEEGGTTDFTFLRTGDTTDPMVISVSLSTVGDTLMGVDYTLNGGGITQTSTAYSVTIEAGEQFALVTFNALDDIDAEADNTLTLSIIDTAAYHPGALNEASTTIPANDLVVTNANYSGDGTLVQAVLNANAFPTDDVITFTINEMIPLNGELVAEPNGSLTIDGGNQVSISGEGVSRILTVASGAEVTLLGVRLFSGSAENGGAIYVDGGSLTLVANSVGASTANTDGGAIYNAGGIVTLNSTAVYNGFATNGSGGGIYNTGALILINSTILSNLAFSGSGGGIYNASGGTTEIYNSTLSGGYAAIGGNVFSNGSLTIRNSILANHTSGGDCVGPASVQFSLIEDGGCGTVHNENGNIVGFDPLLGSLPGFFPLYYSLLDSSPAIDAGSNGLIPPGVITDQLEQLRVQGAQVDMGSVEYDPTLPVLTVTVGANGVEEGNATTITVSRTGDTTDPLDVEVFVNVGSGMLSFSDYTLSGGDISGASGAVTITIPATMPSADIVFDAIDDIAAEADNFLNFALVDTGAYNLGASYFADIVIPANDLVVTTTDSSDEGSLLQAVTNANTFPTDDVITFAATGTFTVPYVLEVQANGALTINSGGVIAISGGGASQVFYIYPGADLTLNNLLVTEGAAMNGGAIYVDGGSLTLNRAAVTQSLADGGNGGAIYNAGGTVALRRSTIHGNGADSGGGIYNDSGMVTLTNSTVAQNGVFGSGGGIYNTSGGTVTLYNSTVAEGGVYTDGSLFLYNSILANSGSGDCIGSATAQFSLVEDGGCGVIDAVDGNITGQEPGFGTLTGFPFAYYPLDSASPAIDAGSNGLLPTGVTTDQPGNQRISGAAVDMGSVEFGASPASGVRIEPDFASIAENGSVTLTLTRVGDTNGTLEVQLLISAASSDMTDSDYDLFGVSGQIGSVTATFSPGESQIDIIFNGIDDSVAEPDNTLFLSLVDTGAYEVGTPNLATVTILREDFGITTAVDNIEGSLRQAVENANLLDGADEVILPDGMNFSVGSLSIYTDMTLTGNLSQTLSGSQSVLNINGGDVLLRGFTITGGSASHGGGIYVSGGNVTIGNDPVIITDNHATICGGGLYVGTGATVIVEAGSQIYENTSDNNGGGICVEGGSLTVQGESQINDNTATSGMGGGIYHASGSTIVNGAIINSNFAGSGGGAIFFDFSGTRSVTATCITDNSDISVAVNGAGSVATGNWWGSPAGPYSGDFEPNPPNDDNTFGSAGDSVTHSTSPAFFDYSSYAITPLYDGCLVCNEVSSMGGASFCTPSP